MSAGITANNDGSADITVGGVPAIEISAATNITIPGNLTVTGTLTYPNPPTTFTSVLRAYPSGTQTVGSLTKVNLNTVSFDSTGNSWDAANTRFNPKRAGYYEIYSQILCNPGAQVVGGFIGYIHIFKNGSGNSISSIFVNGSGFTQFLNFTFTISDIVYLNGSTDYIEIYWQKTSGDTSGLINYTTGTSGTYMTANYVGA